MGRPPERAETVRKVKEYLRKAEVSHPSDMPINFSAIARATGIDRRTVMKHAAKEVEASRKTQLREKLSPRRREEQAYLDTLREKDEEIAVWRGRYEKMLERAFLLEANAKRLGIDPDALYQAIKPPDRTVSRAGRRGRDKRR